MDVRFKPETLLINIINYFRKNPTLLTDLGPDGDVLVQVVFTANGEACNVRSGRPVHVDCALEVTVHFVEQRTAEFRTVVDVRVRHKIVVCHSDINNQ